MSNKKKLSAAEYAWAGFFGLLLIVALVIVVAFIFQALTWNLGVVGLAAAVGLTAAHISLKTAIGAVFLVSLVRSIFRPAQPKQVSDKIANKLSR